MNFFKVLIKPGEVFEAEKKKACYKKAFFNYLLLPIVVGVIAGLLAATVSVLLHSYLALIPGAATLLSFGLLAAVLIPLALLAAQIVLVLIWHALLFGVSKALRSKACFKEHFYVHSTYVIPFYVLALVLTLLLSWIPLVGALVILALGFYSLYLLVEAQKKVHGFGILGLVGSVFISLILFLAVFISLFLWVSAAVISTLGSLA